jgi:hypothetical protein
MIVIYKQCCLGPGVQYLHLMKVPNKGAGWVTVRHLNDARISK